MRLNLGSGPLAVPGWINVDRSPNLRLQRVPGAKKLLRAVGVLNDSHMVGWDEDVKQYDIRSLPFADASVDAVYSSHTLEHLYLADARRCVLEMYRVLRVGGVVRLALPDSEELARRLVEADPASSAEASVEFNRRLLAHPEKEPRLLSRMIGAASGHIHRWQPTYGLVAEMLSLAGFVTIERASYKVGSLPDLDSIETRPESFFVEAIR